MFVLAINILSSIVQSAPPPQVADWLAGQPADVLFTTAVCQAEILAGIAILPGGRRRDDLRAAAIAMFREDFAGRILPFDGAASTRYAKIYAARRRDGRPIATLDLMIAAIARAHGAHVVTRDGGGFLGCGVAVINTWQAA